MRTIKSTGRRHNRIDDSKSTAGSIVRHLLLELFFVVALLQVSSIITVQLCGAFAATSRRMTHTSMGRLYSVQDDDGFDNNNDLLLEKARALRAEASVMENDLRSSASSLDISSPQMAVPVVISNTQLEDSIWTLSYRFSSQPIPKDDTSNNNNQEQQQKNIFYSGKINLRLKEDGYSEQVVMKNNEVETSGSDDIEITKIWGWDRETSNEDDLDYLLFSMDVKLPESDPTTKSNSKKNQNERYYFQARIDTEQENNRSVLVLKDGTITVKRDLTEKTNGRWGLFNVAGILTEFRYCGEFVAKPSSS